MEANIHRFIDLLAFGLNIAGALITVWGAVIALYIFIRKEFWKRKVAVQMNDSLRVKLGSYLVLSLEFFIAADIIKTILTPTWESIGMLGAIVIIRTVLSYFLTKDLKDYSS
ncbi:MAG: DUF1622 domain-containing protein [Candidatus Omnitrophica bacterium]|nr:DUF1622 domain-containing protein [Candidatus Omnitrophota bacterium]